MVLSCPERQRREATPVHWIADEAMGFSFEQEDPSTKNGGEGKGCPFFFGCVGDGLGLALKAACQTDSLQRILRLTCPEISLKEMDSAMILPSPRLYLHIHLGWRKLHYW